MFILSSILIVLCKFLIKESLLPSLCSLFSFFFILSTLVILCAFEKFDAVTKGRLLPTEGRFICVSLVDILYGILLLSFIFLVIFISTSHFLVLSFSQHLNIKLIFILFLFLIISIINY